MSVTYLPVYALSENTSPTSSDFIVFQSSAQNGDVQLLSVSNFISTFLESYIEATEIDSSTIDLYTSMGWTAPTQGDEP